MQIRRFIKSIFVMIFCSLAFVVPANAKEAPRAELVSTFTADHVLLHGLLYPASKPSRSVVLHLPGGPGSFYSMQDMAPLARDLNAKGYNFLSINLRSAGANGILFTKFEDYYADIAAAIQLCKSRGMTEVVLLGHSLSGPRAFYYMSRAHDPAVRAIVLSGVITSPYEEAQLRWNAEERAQYDRFLQDQRDTVKAGDGRRLATFPWSGGHQFEMSAATWVSIFGTPAESNASTVKYARDITVPVLIVHGMKDEGALPANAKIVLASLVNSPSKSVTWVAGANHLFIGSSDVYGRIVSDWVVRTIPPIPTALHRGRQSRADEGAVAHHE